MIFLQVDNDEHRETTIFLVLENPNVERMAKADPVTVNSQQHGGIMRPVKYPQAVQLVVCYEPDTAQLHKMASLGGASELLRYLMRGYNFDEKQGDGPDKMKALKMRTHAGEGMQA